MEKQRKERMVRDTVAEEVAQYRRLAERYEREGSPAMALLLRNVVFIAEGGDMSDYEWAKEHERKDGKLDDVTVRAGEAVRR